MVFSIVKIDLAGSKSFAANHEALEPSIRAVALNKLG